MRIKKYLNKWGLIIMFEKNMKSSVFFTAVLIFAFVFIFVIQGVEYGEVAPGNPEDEVAETEEVNESGEVYTASAEGYGGELTVDVEIADNKIIDVKIVDHKETDNISDPAIENVPAAIVENQSTDVDVASGATVTSEAIMEAVTNALDDVDLDSGVFSDEESEQEGSVNDEAEDENRVVEGIGQGYGGDIVVEVEIGPDEEIKAINIIDHNETDGFSDPAFEEIPSAIIDAQSTNVDVASGATMTSEGIIEAVNSVLE